MKNEKQKNEDASVLTKNAFLLTVLFLGIPLVFQVGSFVFNGLQNGKFVVSGDWLGFWGGYLGVWPSGVIAAAVAGYQIKAANKQSYQSRQQELIIMRNSKLIDYCYEMKGAVSKSIVILDSRIQLEARTNLEDQALALYRYEYFVSTVTANIFEETNYECLVKSNNTMYYITNVLSNLMKQEMLDEQNKYTKNLTLLERFLHSYSQYDASNKLDAELVEEYPDLKEMQTQLKNISDLIDKTIEELSA